MIKLGVLLFLLTVASSYSQEFLRELPESKFTDQITKEKFPASDAVIILKEQSLNMTKSTVFYNGVDLVGPAIVTSEVLIIKLLTELGVKRYGSFEYEYYEPYGDDIPFGFAVKSRVLKKDGKIEVLSEKEIKKIISLTWNDGTPLKRKVMFKFPNLSIGDIVQIEYQLNESLSENYGGTILYSDKDYVIFSNAYLTLPSKAEFNVSSFPKDKIGEPVIRQMSKDYGSGKTYFWSVKNLSSIPDEPFSFPFEDQSYMTAFNVKFEWNYLDKVRDWVTLGKFFFQTVIDKGSISGSELEDLNLPRSISDINFDKTDSLYASLKKIIKVADYNSIYPSKGFSDVFKTKKGKATDIAFLMYKILEKWDHPGKIVLIRDKRKGGYEESVPALEWFNRMGVLVTIDGKEKLYDFDPAIPDKYENPWFLNSAKVFVVEKGNGYNKIILFPSSSDDNIKLEYHKLNISSDNEVNDSIILSFCGSVAQNLRSIYYLKDEKDITDDFSNQLTNSCMSKIDSIKVNNIFDSGDIIITATGRSSSLVEPIDSFLVVKLKNNVFRGLKDKLFTSKRKGHILFDSPFKYRFVCDIRIPKGFQLKSLPGNLELPSSFKGKFNLKFLNDNELIRIDGVLNITENVIPSDKYKELLNLIDGSINAVEKDIILRKSL